MVTLVKYSVQSMQRERRRNEKLKALIYYVEDKEASTKVRRTKESFDVWFDYISSIHTFIKNRINAGVKRLATMRKQRNRRIKLSALIALGQYKFSPIKSIESPTSQLFLPRPDSIHDYIDDVLIASHESPGVEMHYHRINQPKASRSPRIVKTSRHINSPGVVRLNDTPEVGKIFTRSYARNRSDRHNSSMTTRPNRSFRNDNSITDVSHARTFHNDSQNVKNKIAAINLSVISHDNSFLTPQRERSDLRAEFEHEMAQRELDPVLSIRSNPYH